MLEVMPRTVRQALSTRRAGRTDGPRRLMALFALVGAAMIVAGVVLAIAGSPFAVPVGVGGAVVQAGGFVGAFWWAMRHPPLPRGRRRS
jgi:hypothetical protein